MVKKKSPSKYVTTSADFISQKASDRKHIPAPGKQQNEEWRQWWMQPEDQIGAATETIILKIEEEQSLRFTSFINWARLYGNWEAMSWGSNVLNNTNQDINNESPLRLNLIQSGIDAAAAKIAKDEPQPYFITTGAKNYFDKLKAEKCTRYVKGVMQQAKVNGKSISQFRDSEVYGTGALHFYYDNDDKMQCDWVPTFELRVADQDGVNMEPRSLHRVRMMSKEKLLAKFPKQEELINSITTVPTNRLRDANRIVDMLRVKESWHLQSSKKKNDGVYTFTINDKCLVKEKYTLPFFPIVVNRWMNKMLGFYGRSVTEEVYSLQLSLDDLLNVAAQSYSMIGMPYWVVPDGADVVQDHVLMNFIGRMIKYNGNTPPQVVSPEPLPASFFQWVQWHVNSIFQIIGISQSSATSTNQLGPNASGEAIRELVDIETSRFSQVSTMWEDNFKQIANVIVGLTTEQAKSNPELKITYIDKRKRAFEYNFKDVQLDSFTIGCDVVSKAPDKIAGRVQTVNDYVERNWITPERAMEMDNLDPDLQEEVRVQTSSLNLCEQRLSEMVEFGTAYLPEPYMLNLPEVQKLSQGIYNMLVADGCPEDRLQLVRNWILALVNLKNDPTYQSLQQPPPQQQAPAQPGQIMPASNAAAMSQPQQ